MARGSSGRDRRLVCSSTRRACGDGFRVWPKAAVQRSCETRDPDWSVLDLKEFTQKMISKIDYTATDAITVKCTVRERPAPVPATLLIKVTAPQSSIQAVAEAGLAASPAIHINCTITNDLTNPIHNKKY